MKLALVHVFSCEHPLRVIFNFSHTHIKNPTVGENAILWMRSLWMIWIWISNPRSLQLSCIKGTHESTLSKISQIHFMPPDPSEPRSSQWNTPLRLGNNIHVVQWKWNIDTCTYHKQEERMTKWWFSPSKNKMTLLFLAHIDKQKQTILLRQLSRYIIE